VPGPVTSTTGSPEPAAHVMGAAGPRSPAVAGAGPQWQFTHDTITRAGPTGARGHTAAGDPGRAEPSVITLRNRRSLRPRAHRRRSARPGRRQRDHDFCAERSFAHMMGVVAGLGLVVASLVVVLRVPAGTVGHFGGLGWVGRRLASVGVPGLGWVCGVRGRVLWCAAWRCGPAGQHRGGGGEDGGYGCDERDLLAGHAPVAGRGPWCVRRGRRHGRRLYRSRPSTVPASAGDYDGGARVIGVAVNRDRAAASARDRCRDLPPLPFSGPCPWPGPCP